MVRLRFMKSSSASKVAAAVGSRPGEQVRRPRPVPALFRWECDPSGEIAWVEGAPRGALIGRSIARPRSNDGSEIDQDVVRAFAVRAPFRDAALLLAGEGAVSGEWKISGVPAFDPADGRFRGYRGIALREVDGAVDDVRPKLFRPGFGPRTVHEIKTPLNAIIGFAEIIEGQYLGSADLPYRERAERDRGSSAVAVDRN